MSSLMKADLVPKTVRCINLAGEALPVSLVRHIEEQLPDARIFDLYGPTETTTYSTFTQRHAEECATIGRPIANTRIYLLDDCLQPVPVEVPGQIFIAGEGVARGYLNRAELTTEKFVRLADMPHQDRAYQVYGQLKDRAKEPDGQPGTHKSEQGKTGTGKTKEKGGCAEAEAGDKDEAKA